MEVLHTKRVLLGSDHASCTAARYRFSSANQPPADAMPSSLSSSERISTVPNVHDVIPDSTLTRRTELAMR
jgi:hypothetical protein